MQCVIIKGTCHHFSFCTTASEIVLLASCALSAPALDQPLLHVIYCDCLEQATTISPWVVTLDALEPFRCPAPAQDPAVLSYLKVGIHLKMLSPIDPLLASNHRYVIVY